MNKRKIMMMWNMVLHPFAYTCKDTEKLLFDFVEAELEPKRRAKLERHLQDCPECMEVVRTYRRTIELTNQLVLREADMPPRLQEKLRQFIDQNPDLK